MVQVEIIDDKIVFLPETGVEEYGLQTILKDVWKGVYSKDDIDRRGRFEISREKLFEDTLG